VQKMFLIQGSGFQRRSPDQGIYINGDSHIEWKLIRISQIMEVSMQIEAV
jgi:hypothetical protein